jgi:hypothetical protein
MKIFTAILFLWQAAFFVYTQESDSLPKKNIEHHIGFELLGKQVYYSLYYEAEFAFRKPKHFVGMGLGLNTHKTQIPVARYFSNCLHLYYSYGNRNQIKTSLAYNLSTNITNLLAAEEPTESEGKRSDFIKSPSISIGYLRKTKNNRLSYGANLLGMMAYYDLYNSLSIVEKIELHNIYVGIFLHYNFLQ